MKIDQIKQYSKKTHTHLDNNNNNNELNARFVFK